MLTEADLDALLDKPRNDRTDLLRLCVERRQLRDLARELSARQIPTHHYAEVSCGAARAYLEARGWRRQLPDSYVHGTGARLAAPGTSRFYADGNVDPDPPGDWDSYGRAVRVVVAKCAEVEARPAFDVWLDMRDGAAPRRSRP